mmetsp:Transcript_125343/g.304355  ORF Transcript_125343/g.304355 Transcript_125343/m.304355 type:complete len:288 (-) Transcript_125343:87-950(-)
MASVTNTCQVKTEALERTVSSQNVAKAVRSPRTMQRATSLLLKAMKWARSHTALRTKHTTQLAGFMKAIILIFVRAWGCRPPTPRPQRTRNCNNTICPAARINETKRKTMPVVESVSDSWKVATTPPRTNAKMARNLTWWNESRPQIKAATWVIRTPVDSMKVRVQGPVYCKLLFAKPSPRPSAAPAHARQASCGHVNSGAAAASVAPCRATPESRMAARSARPRSEATASAAPATRSRRGGAARPWGPWATPTTSFRSSVCDTSANQYTTAAATRTPAQEGTHGAE